MRLTIHDHYGRHTETLEGTPESIENQLVLMFPDQALHVDPDEGLDELVEWLNDTYHSKDFVLEPFESMAKHQPGPKAFPKLGVHSQSQNVDMVSANRNLEMKSHLKFHHTYLRDVDTSGFDQDKLQDARQAYVRGETRLGQRGNFFHAFDPGHTEMGRDGKVTRVPKQTVAHFGTVKAGPMAFDNETVLGTLHHEAFHGLMSKVAEKHGPMARVHLARNLWLSLPKQYRPYVDALQEHFTGDAHRGKPEEHEEKLARLLNYLNSSEDRESYHGAKGHEADERQEHNLALKRTAQALRAIAEVADEKWLHHNRTPWMQQLEKAEELGKATWESVPERLMKGSDWLKGLHRHGEYYLAPYANPGTNEWSVSAYSANGTKVGEAQFAGHFRTPEEHEDQTHLIQDGLKGWNVEVHPDHRRKGLASAMYGHAERHFKLPVYHGDFQTPEGGAFLSGMKKTVLDPNHGYSITHEIWGENGSRMTVLAHTKDGREAGRADLDLHPEHIHAAGILVEPEHRRRGLGSAMFAHAESVTGKKVSLENTVMTASGKAFTGGNAALTQPQFGKSELEKSRPGPTFPRLGLSDDRRETPILDSEQAVANKQRAFLAANAPKNADIGAFIKQNHGLVDDAAGLAYAGKKPNVIGYARASSINTSGVAGEKSDVATKLHEDFHQMMNRVERKYGAGGRRNLAMNLFYAIPAQYRDYARVHSNTYGPHTRSLSHEEHLAHVLNYTNDPGYRAAFHQERAKLGEPPEQAREYQTAMNVVHRSMLTAAEVAHEGWVKGRVQKSEEKFKKSEPSNLGEDKEHETVRDMHGFRPHTHSIFSAARFLIGAKDPVPLERIRGALWRHDGDAEAAALTSYGMTVNDLNRKALRAVQRYDTLGKFQGPELGSVQPGISDAEETAKAVDAAVSEGRVEHVKLGGVHSAGSLLVRGHDHAWLMKPGANGQSTAAGAAQEQASQSRREAAFWHVAEIWALGEDIPRADLVLMNGHEYACIHMLPFTWKNADKIAKKDHNRVLQAVETYRKQGTLHRWAILDFVLGNPDRHGQNLMMSPEDKLQLIDHGSAFAGSEFDPGHDDNSFVPYYLRASVEPGKFTAMGTEDRLRIMPSLDLKSDQALRTWVDGLSATVLSGALARYGVDPTSSLVRLQRVKALDGPMYEGINRLWVTT